MPDEAPVTEQDQPTDAPEAPETDQPREESPESFTDFDPSQIPEDADREWLAQRYSQMQGDYTRKTMEIGERQRNAEQAEALMQGLRDPDQLPHYLKLLDVDLTDPETLRRFGFQLAEEEEEELLDPDELDPHERISRLEQEREAEREEREAAKVEQALDEIADTQLEAIEKQWDRKLDEDEDAFLRFHAESNPSPDGMPDYASAAKLLKSIISRRTEEELKRRSEPGRGQPGGKPGGKALDPNKEEDRVSLGAAAAEKAMASQSQ